MDREQESNATEDRELIKAFIGGGAAAFDRLVLKYNGLAYTLCYRFFGDCDEANDCAQEAFVKVYRSLKDFKGESSFSTWLYTIVLNTCRTRMGSLAYRIKKFTVGLDAPKNPDDGIMARDMADSAPPPGEELERREEENIVQKAIDKLDKKARELVILRDIEGLSYEEIITITGYNPGTLKSKLARARQQLKAKLEVYAK